MSIDDDELLYLSGSLTENLYVYPTKVGNPTPGAVIRLIGEDQELIGNVEISERCRLIVSLFHSSDLRDFKSMKITKIRQHGTHWRRDSAVEVSRTQRSYLVNFLELMLSLNFQGAQKTRISVDRLSISALSSLLRTDKGPQLIESLANSPELTADIFALAHKKQALNTFGTLLSGDAAIAAYKREHDIRKSGREAAWQHFFEVNPWIFGHGLSYVFLERVAKKLEVTTTGATFINAGDRIDALMKTKAAASQFVLIEIKTPELDLLGKEYRTGCWAIHQDLTDAVSQVQKTTFDFTANQTAKVQLRDKGGWMTGEEVYRVQPKSYLVAGRLDQMRGNDDRITCFELFRRSLTSPEILTFDELYERAKCIIATISADAQPAATRDDEDDVPF